MENKSEQDRNRGTRINVQTTPRTYASPGGTQERSVQTQVEEKTQEVKREAEEAGQELRERASEVAGQVEERTRSMFDQRKGQAAGELHQLASAFRRTSEQLRMEDKGSVATYGERIANQIDRISDSIESKSTEELIDDVEDFARERPEIFLGGAFALGLLAARILRSPTRRRTSQYRQSRPYYGSVVEREAGMGTWTVGRAGSSEEVR